MVAWAAPAACAAAARARMIGLMALVLVAGMGPMVRVARRWHRLAVAMPVAGLVGQVARADRRKDSPPRSGHASRRR